MRLMQQFRDWQAVYATAVEQLKRIRMQIKIHCNALSSDESR